MANRLNLINPCPSAALTLFESPFTDKVTWRRENIYQYFDVNEIASLSTDVDCGAYQIDFFTIERDELDGSLFRVENVESLGNAFVILKTESELKVGEYQISFRVSLAEYPENTIESR